MWSCVVGAVKHERLVSTMLIELLTLKMLERSFVYKF